MNWALLTNMRRPYPDLPCKDLSIEQIRHPVHIILEPFPRELQFFPPKPCEALFAFLPGDLDISLVRARKPHCVKNTDPEETQLGDKMASTFEMKIMAHREHKNLLQPRFRHEGYNSAFTCFW